MDRRLNIAFVWHMHQPLYKDPFTGEYTMPWVLFHGTKDYYDMVALLDEFPNVHQTFNFVPCLIEQINEYSSGAAKDKYMVLTKKPVSELTHDDKSFILRNFFQANWEHMIKPHERYRELLIKRGTSSSADDIRTVLRFFVDQDYIDLQVLFNLVWIDPHIRANDPFLTGLVQKGKGFSEEDKAGLIEKQIEIMGMILPKYAEMQEKGIVEVSTTPYYHPILPLLCDSFSAKEAMPWATLPKERFQYPEDARVQLERAVELYTSTFGIPPRGLWPSEGSVSMDVLPLVAAQGIRWLATDEEILSNSLRRPIRRDHAGHCYDPFLYRPYEIDAGDSKLSMVFRDHILSDLIGFDYARMSPEAAASDLIARLTHIHNMVEHPERHVVSIILDGENAWETYKNDGRDFFVALYSKLNDHPLLKCTTVSEVMQTSDEHERLDWLYPGSWISHNFKIWIGHQEDNAAWDFIYDARGELVKYEENARANGDFERKKEAIEKAWDALYAAEGSDWFWWYGEEHSTMSDEYFDSLFRLYIKRIYDLIEVEPPFALDIPISTEAKGTRPKTLPTAFINPTIDGDISNYFEWLAAGVIERQYQGTAMHREISADGVIESIAYGFSEKDLFFRFDYVDGLDPEEKEWSATITFHQPAQVKVRIRVHGRKSSATVLVKPEDADKWVEDGVLETIASDRVTELAIPLELLKASWNSELRLIISIDGGELGIESWPVKGYLILQAPSEDFEQSDWIV